MAKRNTTPALKIDRTELLANFRAARSKSEQICIEADLHCVAPRVIAELLRDAGALEGTYIKPSDYSDVYKPVPPAKPRKAGRKVSFDETEALRQYREGVTFDEMSRSLGVGADTLSKWAKRRGLTRERTDRRERREMTKFKLRETEEAAIAREEEILASVDAGKKAAAPQITCSRTEPCNPCVFPARESCAGCIKEGSTVVMPAAAPTICQPGKAVGVWDGYVVPQPDRRPADRDPSERVPLTVNQFLALVGKLLTPVLDAEISLNGERVTDVYGYEVKVRGDRVFVDVRTREAGNV